MNRIIWISAIALILSSCTKEVNEELVDIRDGRVYPTVKIGKQIWMAQNLAYMPFVSELASDSGIWVFGYNGTSIDWAKNLPEYKTLGCLYSWPAAMNISNNYANSWWGGSDSLQQGICPDGWHLPSDTEWQMLEEFLDTEPEFESEDERQNTGNAGQKMKADSLWAPNMEGNNASGLNVLPSGMRYNTGYYLNQFTYSYFWTATEKYPGSATYRYLRDSSDATYRGFPSKLVGMSVRCVKD